MKIFRKSFIIFWGLSVFSFIYSNNSIILNGVYKFCPGDNFKYALLNYNDSKCKPIKIPGSIQSQKINTENNMGWYRIYFSIPDSFDLENIAIFLGIIVNAEEIFFNGKKIGGEGIIGKNATVSVYPPFIYRVVKLPKNLIRISRKNLLAIRLINNYFEGGIVKGNLILGDFRDMLLKKVHQETNKKIVELAEIFLLLFIFIGSIFVYFKFSGSEKTEFLIFSSLIFFYILFNILESVFFYELGFKTPFIQKFSYALIPVIIALFLLFLINFFKNEFNWHYIVIIIELFIFSLILLSFLSCKNFNFFLVLWITNIIISAIALITIIIKALKKNTKNTIPIIIGSIFVIFFGFGGDIAASFGISINLAYYPLYSWDYGTFLFIICLLYAIISRTIESQKRIQQLSRKIFTIHEEERKRIARELHDGLGQDLLAVKFNLQRVNRKINNHDIEYIIEELERCNDELKEITNGLRPELLEEMGIETVIRIHCKNLGKIFGINFNLNIYIVSKLPSLIEDNLFRIFQEAINNIIKHSEANKVAISLIQISNKIIMKIEDNGKGFEYNKITMSGKGLGLTTISERVKLIGGNLKINSKKNRGTSIKVEVMLA